VSIANGARQHGTVRLDIPIREQPGQWPRITIGRDTWIGDRAVVLADVGKHCVIGAGAVVTKPIPDYAVAVGNPARVIRFREGSEKNESEIAGPSAVVQAIHQSKLDLVKELAEPKSVQETVTTTMTAGPSRALQSGTSIEARL
jgi:tetrahydrodipicolinate N-succinyltransferase